MQVMKKLAVFLVERLKERSTWLGIITLATAAGVHVSPGMADLIVKGGAGAASAVAIFTKG